jgi:hypothetical protein
MKNYFKIYLDCKETKYIFADQFKGTGFKSKAFKKGTK